MARKTIIVGLNQTIMAALSMATISAFVDGPGLASRCSRVSSGWTSEAPSSRASLIVVMARHARPDDDGSQRTW